MNKDKEAYQQLLVGIQEYVNKCLNESNRDLTITAIVKSLDNEDDNTYSILINNKIYSDIPTIGGTCNVNETVRVIVPQGNYNNMFILKGGSGSSSGGGTIVSGVSSVNGKTGAVVLNNIDVGALSYSYKQKIDLWDLQVNEDGSVSLIYNGGEE